MKLTLNRREEKEGFIRKSTVYYLDVDIQVTDEEMSLIKKHKWGERAMCREVFNHTQDMEWTMVLDVYLKDKPAKHGFKTIERLASAENQIVENARALKAKLESVAGFATAGPQEVEL
mgnify:CR=1 FL=1